LFSSGGTCILAPDVTQGPYCQIPSKIEPFS
jgi:hypothetical protein